MHHGLYSVNKNVCTINVYLIIIIIIIIMPETVILLATSATRLAPNILHHIPLDPASKVERGFLLFGQPGTHYHLPRLAS